MIGAVSQVVPRSDLADAAAWIDILGEEIAAAEARLAADRASLTAEEIAGRENDLEAARAERRAITNLLAAETALRGGA